MIYIDKIGEECFGLNIWLKTLNYGTDIKDIICIIWSKRIMKQRHSNLQQQHSINFTIYEAYYISYTNFN